MSIEPCFVSIAGLARRLRLPASSLRRAAAAGEIPFLMFGNRRVFEVGEVVKVLNERARKNMKEIHYAT